MSMLRTLSLLPAVVLLACSSSSNESTPDPAPDCCDDSGSAERDARTRPEETSAPATMDDAKSDATNDATASDAAADVARPDSAPSKETGGTDSAPPTDDLGAAKAFVQPLGIGVNIERGWAWSMPGQDAAHSTKYWAYLRKEAHVTHVRFFYPWRPSIVMGGGGANNAPPDEAAFGRILDASEQAIAAGLRVFLDCTDVLGTEDVEGDNGNETTSHIEHCAAWTAKWKLDPTMFALGSVNEWAGGDDNTLYNAHRKRFHAILRKALPGYVLTTGPAYWKSRDYLYDTSKKFETFDDLRVVYEWHHYSSLDRAGWTAEESKLASWRASHGGRPTVCGEAGAGYWDEPVSGGKLEHVPQSWPSRFEEMLGPIAAERPMLWAVTYGGSYRLNKTGDDAMIMDGSGGQPDLLQMIREGAAAIAAAK